MSQVFSYKEMSQEVGGIIQSFVVLNVLLLSIVIIVILSGHKISKDVVGKVRAESVEDRVFWLGFL